MFINPNTLAVKQSLPRVSEPESIFTECGPHIFPKSDNFVLRALKGSKNKGRKPHAASAKAAPTLAFSLLVSWVKGLCNTGGKMRKLYHD